MQKYDGPKYVVVTGGVMSGVGKGITTASMGKILLNYGYSCTAVKIDPYLNYDAGTMRPTEHGEVWVTDDGGEIAAEESPVDVAPDQAAAQPPKGLEVDEPEEAVSIGLDK